MTLVGIFIILVFLFSCVSARLERTFLTPPIVFTVSGMLVLLLPQELWNREGSPTVFLRVAEIGLVMLLFSDASRVDLKLLKEMRALPVRLLSTGMLLTILLGALCAFVLFPDLNVWQAGILAAILAPTDAGLGQVIVSSPRVPLRVRQALNVEAGLNDGLSVPFLLFFMQLAGPGSEAGNERLLRFTLEQLGGGILIGMAIGYAGGAILEIARRKNWMAKSFHQLGLVTLPLLCIVASEMAEASMFIAAFAAGLSTQARFPEAGQKATEFTEQWGQLLNYSIFFLFGVLVAREWPQIAIGSFLYAILSLTLVRMLPVALALKGTGLHKVTVLFMGWFGPRGLASIVLGLVYLAEVSHQPAELLIRHAVMATVLLSIVVHGLSANPGITLHARFLGKSGKSPA